MFNLTAVQNALKQFGFDGWLLYDFRGSNLLAQRVLQLPADFVSSRRFLYFVPTDGEPQKLVHRIENDVLDHLPGKKNVYLKWQELEAGIEAMVSGCKSLAMEYSPRNGNPYISRVDAGTVELVKSFGCDVQASGDLISIFEATLSEEQLQAHYAACDVCNAAFGVAWKFIADQVRANASVEEKAVQDTIMQHFADHNLTTYHPPIVGVNENGGNPHYETGHGANTTIRENDFVLIDLWAKQDKPDGIYSDLTRTGFVGTEVPEKYTKIFNIVAAGRDAGIECVKAAFAAGTPLQGWQVDDAVRNVIADAGYGEYFCHRTGHSMGQETHGNGTHIDNLETHETRLLLPRTLFTIEPGIYLPEFGVRSEVDVYIHADGRVEVTGGPVQTEVVKILAQF
ncbi:M24 family metallopeptidase [Fuerstiella marisgermanici]|uniref:Xaa-Pro dipeptidase n=1 Tax=Fuerstiella marisgermanici TaxID=1891926 RepID=A0A1P8WKR1_9PLAN|nr:M24 family metallopeptidase [Fuerstiella marisgermanici]APZ94654.1 Xaa-Pro dipeptidase [Fuerstiella marisgermanici]